MISGQLHVELIDAVFEALPIYFCWLVRHLDLRLIHDLLPLSFARLLGLTFMQDHHIISSRVLLCQKHLEVLIVFEQLVEQFATNGDADILLSCSHVSLLRPFAQTNLQLPTSLNFPASELE